MKTKQKRFIIGYKFTASGFASNFETYAISREQAESKLRNEVEMCYGSQLAETLIIIN